MAHLACVAHESRVMYFFPDSTGSLKIVHRVDGSTCVRDKFRSSETGFIRRELELMAVANWYAEKER